MNDLKNGLNAYFTADHRRCDELWATVEAAAGTGDKAGSARAFGEFDAAMRHHLDMEEQVMFPAFEEAMNMHGGGPTYVMRMEHRQMRAVLDQMGGAASSGALDALLDQGDTLMMLIQQHNVKEEGMLYPMAERALDGPTWEALAERIAALPH